MVKEGRLLFAQRDGRECRHKGGYETRGTEEEDTTDPTDYFDFIRELNHTHVTAGKKAAIMMLRNRYRGWSYAKANRRLAELSEQGRRRRFPNASDV